MPPPADWNFGPQKECHAPGKAAWKLDPDVREYDALAPEVHNDLNPGALALAGEEGAWNLYWTQVDGLFREDLQTRQTTLVSDRVVAHALAQGDMDQDGSIDLVFAAGAVGVMYGDGTFAPLGNRRDNAGATDVATTDLDGDGDLDVLVAWSAPDHSNPSAMRGEIIWNEGNRVFTAVDMDGFDEVWGPAFDFTARDVNGDGAMDAYLCNDMGAEVAPNRLFLGDGASLAPHSGEGLDQRLSCMGSTWGDLDHDGSLELYISESVRHVMMKQDDQGNWYDIANTLGLTSNFGEHTMSWGAALADFDNNGRMELVDALGDFWIAGQLPNRIGWFEQNDDGTMVDIGDDRGVPEFANGRGVIAQDLNGDGVLDLLLGDANRTPWMYLSEGCTEDNWLEVEAPGGSEVRVEVGDWVQAARIDNESGWGSSGPTVAHLGLAGRKTVDRVVLRLADGTEVQVDGPIGARRRLTYVQP